MLFQSSTVDQYVIQKDYYSFVQQICKKIVHTPHECCRSIAEAKGHHYPLILPITCEECSFGNVTFLNSTLPISRSKIQTAKILGTSKLVYELLTSG